MHKGRRYHRMEKADSGESLQSSVRIETENPKQPKRNHYDHSSRDHDSHPKAFAGCKLLDGLLPAPSERITSHPAAPSESSRRAPARCDQRRHGREIPRSRHLHGAGSLSAARLARENPYLLCIVLSRAQNPDKQSAQEKYRSWSSHSHVENCTLPQTGITNYPAKTPA